jgi:hypothetical protein
VDGVYDRHQLMLSEDNSPPAGMKRIKEGYEIWGWRAGNKRMPPGESVGSGLWEVTPVIWKSEDKAERCLKAAMRWCLFWCVELLAGNRIR